MNTQTYFKRVKIKKFNVLLSQLFMFSDFQRLKNEIVIVKKQKI